jgi:hypothetical protein
MKPLTKIRSVNSVLYKELPETNRTFERNFSPVSYVYTMNGTNVLVTKDEIVYTRLYENDAHSDTVQ